MKIVKSGEGVVMRRKLSSVLKILVLILGVVTVIMGLNEATKDVLDPIGSNYWLAYSAVLSGIALIAVVLILSYRREK